MMRRDTGRLDLRCALQVCALLVLMLGLAACNSDNFIIPPPPEMAQEMMPAEEEPQMHTAAVVAAATQSGLGCVSVVNEDGVRLRTGPGADFPVLGLAYKDDALPMEGLASDKDWVAVTAPDGRVAYIFAALADAVCPEG